MSRVLGVWVEVEIKEYDEDLNFWDVIAWRETMIPDEDSVDAYISDVEASLSESQKRGKVYTNTLVRCSCGEEIICRKFTNECDECGELYNKYGQHLNPREEWEDEY